MSIDATRATWKLSGQITAIQKLILLALADRAGEDGECWPSIKRLEADTNLNRKTLIDNRKKLIGLGLIELTGEMKGKKKQIPVMRLTYINQREQEFTSTENGIRTSTEFGTRTSTENGTLNLKEESKIRSIPESDDSLHLDEITNEQFIEVFMSECPASPHPMNPKKPSKDALRSFNSLRKIWRSDISKSGKALTKDSFRALLQDMKACKSWLVDPMKKIHIDMLCNPKWVIKFLEERKSKV